MAKFMVSFQIVLPRGGKAAMAANHLRALFMDGSDVSTEMRFGDERLIAVLARKFSHSQMHFANVPVKFRTEQEFFIAITTSLLAIRGRLLMASQHVLVQMTFDHRLIRTVLAFVTFRVRMKHFVAGKHVAL